MSESSTKSTKAKKKLPQLRCEKCNAFFKRSGGRGRPPKNCPKHHTPVAERGKKAAPVVAAAPEVEVTKAA